ncbi:sodium:solute symporter family protein [Streptomyces diastatochromogenes]|uniref:sodium:solute symporter family protein n=1 Tax=Streptomyces diastatochromogenes TaxID=42236 RepID=UPI0036D0B9C2
MPISVPMMFAFGVPLVTAWAIALSAAWRGHAQELINPTGWALADRRLAGVKLWAVLGATIFTAYTYIVMPGRAFLSGGCAYYAVAYMVMVTPLGFLILPRFREFAAEHGFVTAADFVRARNSSHVLALVVALTSLLAAVPYLTLQVVSLRTLLDAMGLPPGSTAGRCAILAMFTVHAVTTHRGGLRVPVSVAMLKAVLILGTIVTAFVMVAVKLGPLGPVLERAQGALADRGGSILIAPMTPTAYATLALGSALALLVYPHVVTLAYASRTSESLRKSVVFLPVWTLVLGCFTLLGVIAAGLIPVSAGAGALAVPLLIRHLAPGPAAGLMFGAITVGSLLPAAVLCLAVAMQFARNVYSEYINPTATPKHEVQVARFTALVLRVAALVCALLLHPQDAVNLHLLGGVWMVQVFPTVAIGLFTAWFHPRALLAGWGVGMAAGTWLSVAHGFSPIVTLPWGRAGLQVYTAVVALALNLGTAVLLTVILQRMGVARGIDTTGGGGPLERRGRSTRMRVH